MHDPVAGWYPNPADPSQMRYWDGVWTDHVVPILAPHALQGGGLKVPRPHPSTQAVVAKTIAGVLAISSFAVLIAGLVHAPTDPEAVDSLDAGGRMALNVTFYLPFLLVAFVLVPLALVGTLSLARTWAFSTVAIALAGITSAGFAALAYTNGMLRSVTPSVREIAGYSLCCALMSLVLTGLALRLRAGTSHE